MDVQPQRCRNICVTQHFADAFNVNPIFDTARRVSVTESVIAAFSDATLTQDRFKVVLIGAWLHWLNPFGLSGYTHFVTDQKQLFSNTPSYRLEVE